MQGLVNFATAIGDGIAVLLPAFCYLAACGCDHVHRVQAKKKKQPQAAR